MMYMSNKWKKGRSSPCVFNRAPPHEGIGGSGGIAPRILGLGTRCRWVVSFTPRPLYRRCTNSRYPLDKRLGGTQSRYARGGEEKKSLPLPGIEPRSSIM